MALIYGLKTKIYTLNLSTNITIKIYISTTLKKCGMLDDPIETNKNAKLATKIRPMSICVAKRFHKMDLIITDAFLGSLSMNP